MPIRIQPAKINADDANPDLKTLIDGRGTKEPSAETSGNKENKKSAYETTTSIKYKCRFLSMVPYRTNHGCGSGSVLIDLMDPDPFTSFGSGARWVPPNFENTGVLYHNSVLDPDPIKIIIRIWCQIRFRLT
jgi:hypothetical protein